MQSAKKKLVFVSEALRGNFFFGGNLDFGSRVESPEKYTINTRKYENCPPPPFFIKVKKFRIDVVVISLGLWGINQVGG